MGLTLSTFLEWIQKSHLVKRRCKWDLELGRANSSVWLNDCINLLWFFFLKKGSNILHKSLIIVSKHPWLCVAICRWAHRGSTGHFMLVMNSGPEVQTHPCQFKYHCIVRHPISNGPKWISFVFGYSWKVKKNKGTQIFMKLICLTKGFKDGKQFDILSFACVSQHLSL